MNTLIAGVSKLIFCVLILAFSFSACGKRTPEELPGAKHFNQETPPYEIMQNPIENQKSIPDSVFYSARDTGTVMDKPQLAAYYDTDEMKEYYGKRVLPPKFDYDMDLSNKTFLDLRLLRNAIFARNGYLFKDPTLRAYFNQFPWYQPIFSDTTFKVYIDEKEKVFVDKVSKLENEKLADAYVSVDENRMVRLDHVVNLIQYARINDSLMKALEDKNFALASADNDQLFYVYDKNQYGFMPNFITTDLYIQVLHKYLSSLMEGTEKGKLIPTLEDLLMRLHAASENSFKDSRLVKLKVSSSWANTFLAVALSALTGKDVSVEPSMRPYFNDEIKKVTAGDGYGSKFLNRNIFYYSQFKPRGNYTKDETLERYFRCMKWLNTAPMNVDDDDRFIASVMMAEWIQNDPSRKRDFDILNRIIGLWAGKEDNNSVEQLIKLAESDGIKSVVDLVTPQKVEVIRGQVKAMEINRIQPKAANEFAAQEFKRKFVLFTAARYTFDAEILSRLVNVKRPELLRPFPKGLDVFAALGHKSAEDILINEYKETERWPQYIDTLSVLKSEFGHYANWNGSLYEKTMECLNSLNEDVSSSYPLFMQTRFWQKKNLNTSLAGWTELKHDMILYSEQPSAAEMGEGGGPPPPMELSYVEPDVSFWKNAIDLLDFQVKTLTDLGLMNSQSEHIASELKKLAQFLLNISNKELNKEQITDDEFSEMSWIGGRVEQLTFEILGTTELPERERQIGLVADVYSLNDTALEEAVGNVDEIYVIAEINGLPYLTKGACFSYYEFTSKTRLTDEEWKQLLGKSEMPGKPQWLNEIYVKTGSLEARPGYGYNDYVTHAMSPDYKGY